MAFREKQLQKTAVFGLCALTHNKTLKYNY